MPSRMGSGGLNPQEGVHLQHSPQSGIINALIRVNDAMQNFRDGIQHFHREKALGFQSGSGFTSFQGVDFGGIQQANLGKR